MAAFSDKVSTSQSRPRELGEEIMFKRTRFQNGHLKREERKRGPKVWILRWRETAPDGRRVNRKVVVGTVEQYKTEATANKAVAALRIDINKETPQAVLRPLTVEQLVAHYKEKELPEEGSKKAYSTTRVCKSGLDIWILPRWGSYRLSDVRTTAVEDWLGGLPLAPATKARLRNIMHALFNHALRYEWLARNPITLVRQSAKRQRTPDVLEVSEIKALLAELQEPVKTMVFLDASTGLRISELLGLKWADIDFDALEIHLSRAIVDQVVGEMKTEASRKPIPLDSGLAEVLRDWRARSAYNRPEDWVFASPRMNGTQPYSPDAMLSKVLRPAVKRAGITKRVGWHTFRHSYGTLLKANGEDVKVVQESLRHANSRITLEVYTQAVTTAKRQAQSRVVQMIRPEALGAVGTC
jgi:integrase